VPVDIRLSSTSTPRLDQSLVAFEVDELDVAGDVSHLDAAVAHSDSGDHVLVHGKAAAAVQADEEVV
jgi:hypothetical protein